METRLSRKKIIPFAALLLSILFLSGCVDDHSAPASDVPQKTITISIKPSATTLPPGGFVKFIATVSGSSNTPGGEGNMAVNWSIQEGAAGGTISNTISTGTIGPYTAPATTGTFHVIATSLVDPTKSATATVTVSSVLDASFGTNGKVSTAFGGIDTINALVTQLDGKIIVAGSSLNGAETDFTLARYNSSGSLDTTFGSAGIVVTSIGGSAEIKTVALQTDGKIVVGGNTSNIQNSNFAIARYLDDGTLDTTFGANGIVTTSLGGSNDHLNALVIQNDGKIVAGGFSFTPKITEGITPSASIGSNLFALVRYQTNGSLDTSFGTNGRVTTLFDEDANANTLETGEINGLAIQTDGKIVAGGLYSRAGNDDFALARYNSVGTLDTSFDTDGIAITPIDTVANGDDRINALLIQSDGKILVGGLAFDGANNDFALARYDPATGALDTGFDTDGKVTTSIGTRAVIKTLGIQTDNKIIAGGFSFNGTNNDFALARYNTDGSLDTNTDSDPGIHFDTDGKVTTQIGTSTDEINALAIQSNKIIAGGFSVNGMRSDFALAQYDATGNLDTTFDTDGKITTAVGGGSDEINAVAIQGDGKIVVAGFSYGVNQTRNNDFSLARYDTAGNLDTTFDTDGRVTTPIGTDTDEINAVAIQGDDKIVVGGTFMGTTNDFALARYLPDGRLDTSFNATGIVKTPVGSEADELNALALQSDGKIVVAGTAFTGTNNDFALARYNSDGSLDTNTDSDPLVHFDTDGIVTTPIGTGSSSARAMVIQNDGKIVVVGMSSVLNTLTSETDFDVTLVRYNSDGSLDTNTDSDPLVHFDTDGIVTTPIGTAHDKATAVALQPDGKIIVVGTPLIGFIGNGAEDFVLLRYNTDGSLDTAFGSGGKTMTSIGTLANEPLSVAVQTDGKIVVGGYSTSALNSRDFTLARFLSDGTLDTSFGAGGIEISPFSAEIDEIHDITILSDGKILAVGMSTNGHGEDSDFHLARYAP